MKTILISALLLSVALNFTSCRKEGNTLAIITVLDSNSNLVSNAKVVLYGNPQPSLSAIVRVDTAYTDLSGQATFDYTELFKLGQAGFAVLDIRATKGSLTGNGIIKIEEEKTNKETVTIAP